MKNDVVDTKNDGGPDYGYHMLLKGQQYISSVCYS